MSKFVFITGGVCSSLGKGVAASSLASLLECAGLSVSMMKCDPYINVDARNMSPFQHGEVYVTEDGTEADLDLGNYARFTHTELSGLNTVTTGKIYNAVIENERAGLYKGKTVQVIPHITDEIKRRMLLVAKKSNADVVLIEIGGTVGDIESIPFLEAARQLIHESGKGNSLCVHLTLIPTVIGGELKTKPTQHSVKVLQQIGIHPDILLCRCEQMIDTELGQKIALFCNVRKDSVFTSIDVNSSIYELPLSFHDQGLDTKIIEKLGLKTKKIDVSRWKDFLSTYSDAKESVKIALIGNKGDTGDCYKSIYESLFYAAVTGNGVRLDFTRIYAEDVFTSEDLPKTFEGVQGIVISSNYTQRGFLGKLKAITFAREQKIPYFGIDFGMHLMAIEMARNVLGWDDADSSEFVVESNHFIIGLPEEQGAASNSFHVGLEDVVLENKSLIASCYKKTEISERHRNKYCVSPEYKSELNEVGLLCTGKSVDNDMIEALEWKDHPWGIGVQYHPEFVSKPIEPHPLFTAFIRASRGGGKN